MNQQHCQREHPIYIYISYVATTLHSHIAMHNIQPTRGRSQRHILLYISVIVYASIMDAGWPCDGPTHPESYRIQKYTHTPAPSTHTHTQTHGRAPISIIGVIILSGFVRSVQINNWTKCLVRRGTFCRRFAAVGKPASAPILLFVNTFTLTCVPGTMYVT